MVEVVWVIAHKLLGHQFHHRHAQGALLGKLVNVGVHFFTIIRKYGNMDPYSIFYHRSDRISWSIRLN